MKRKRFVALVLALLMCAGLTACGGQKPLVESNAPSTSNPGSSSADNTATYNLNLGTMFYDPSVSTNFNSDGEFTARFKELVEQYSNGRIKITVHWASILGGTTDLVDQLRTGTLDLMAGSVYTATDARFGVFNMPYLFDSLEMTQELFAAEDAPLGKIMGQIYADNQIKLLCVTAGQLRGVFNNVREIHTPEDIDFVFRTYSDDVVTKFWNGLTPNTTNIAISELYTGLQLHTCDGFEFNPCAMIANGYTDVLDYYSDINWQWLCNANLTMSQIVWDKLDAEAQEILVKAAKEASDYYYEIIGQYNKDSYDYMKKNGIEVYTLTDAERKTWEDYGKSLWPEFRDMFGNDVYDEVVGIVDEYYANRR